MIAHMLLGLLLTSPGPQRLDAGDHWVGYEVVGSGPPIVLLAGGPGFGGEVLRPVADLLKDKNTCILFDQRGTGQSVNKDGSKVYSHDAEIMRDLEALRQHLGHEKWVVFGQSWGSHLAAVYAENHPDSVSALILASNPQPTDDGMRVLATNVDMRMPPGELAELNTILNDESLDSEVKITENFFRSLPYYFHDPVIGKELLGKFDRSLFSPLTAIQLLAYYFAFEIRDAARSLRDWPGHVLVIQGHQDPCGSVAGKLVADLFPRSRLVWINECGHFPWLEKPEEFARPVRSFLLAERIRARKPQK
ncbi:MAG: alpha/beta hydrolase [Fimbriimonadaceae bacterium]|nr:alpha/beta hydrolase [Fimbriimonadaceae bacterium]